LAGFHAFVLGHIWYQGELEAITICGSLRNLVRDARLSLLRRIAVLGLSLLLGMLDVSVHLEINQLLVGVYQLVSGIGVDHRELFYLVEVFLQRQGVAAWVCLIFPEVQIHFAASFPIECKAIGVEVVTFF